MKLRYGLRDERPSTLEEIARNLGLSRERVRQIEGRALAKIATLQSIYIASSTSHGETEQET